MTTKNTYWEYSPRNFGNEYTIAVANTLADAESYEAEGYTRIDRSSALSQMVWRGDDATEAWVTVEFNGVEVEDRFQFARALRAGTAGVFIQAWCATSWNGIEPSAYGTGG